MERKIIKIDEELCDGCGNCVSGCSEGALQIIEGKARLVNDQFCDGFGDCIGTCPTGALTIEVRHADEFNEHATVEYLRQTQGNAAVKRMKKAQTFHKSKPQAHNDSELTEFSSSGCPGSRLRVIPEKKQDQPVSGNVLPTVIPSELRQWPVQIHLVPPGAPFFKNKELVVMNSCGAIASADIHWRYLRGRSVVMGCPKLDNTTPYVDKLAGILAETSIPKVVVVRMEVPCCGGLTSMVQEAISQSGRTDLALQEDVLNLDGTVKRSQTLQ